MNERIRELAAAARHYTNDTVLHLERVHNRDYSFEEINEILDTKFAELIVAECIEVFGKDLPDIDDKNFNILDITNRICNVAEHFRVEE